MARASFFLCAAVLSALALVLIAGSLPTADATSGGATLKAATTCCKGCSYHSNCCCAGRDKLPLTRVVTKFVRTRTVTVKRRGAAASAAAQINRRNVEKMELAPLAVQASIAKDAQDVEEHGLFARHECPRCPRNASVLPAGGRSSGGVQYSYCCPQRRTVLKTVRRTRTVTRTGSAVTTSRTQRRVTLTGRVWYDLNRNDIWDGRPIDIPIANTRIFVVLPARRRVVARAENDPLGNTTTDSEGVFVVVFPPQRPGTEMAVVKDLITRDPLQTFKASASGGAPEALIPIERPTKPEVSSTSVANNIATVRGKGRAGFSSVLYCDNVQCGSALIGSDGQFTVPSTFRKSGTTQLSVTQMDIAGRESDLAAAGQAVILQPPTVTSIGPEGNTGVVVGTDVPGASITVYFKATIQSAGTTTVTADGTWTVRVPDLPVGTTAFTATMRDSAGVSDTMEAGSVVITVSASRGDQTTAPQPATTTQAQAQTTFAPTTTSLPTTSQSMTQTSSTSMTPTSSTSLTTTATAYPTSLSVAPSDQTIMTEVSFAFSVLANLSDASQVNLTSSSPWTLEWTSSDPAIANISTMTGLVTGLSNGTVIITANLSSTYGISASGILNVIGIVGLVTEPSQAFVLIGSETQFTARYLYGNENLSAPLSGVSWSVKDADSVNITASGGLMSAFIGAGGNKTSVRASINGRNASASVDIVEICHSFAGSSDAKLVIPDPSSASGSNYAVLSGTGSKIGIRTNDAVGAGWLSLAYHELWNGIGYGYLTDTFTLSSTGLQIEFDFATWRHWDDWAQSGLSMHLFDADVTYAIGDVAAGAKGLGYFSDRGTAGLAGAYIGLGLVDNQNQFCGSGSNDWKNDFVCIRGPVVGFGNGSAGDRTSSSSYELKNIWKSSEYRQFVLNGRSTSVPRLNAGPEWGDGYRIRPAEIAPGLPGYRRVKLRITPAPNPLLSMWMVYGANSSNPVQYFDQVALPAIDPSQKLRIGFAGYSEGPSAYHEVRNVTIVPVVNGEAKDVCRPWLVGMSLDLEVPYLALGDPCGGRTVRIKDLVWSDGVSRGLDMVQGTFTWSSSNAGVIAVNQTGRIAGVSLGSATITATLTGQTRGGPGSASISVTVANPTSIKTVPSAPYLILRATVQMKIAYLIGSTQIPDTCATGTWTGGNQVVANITSPGFLVTIATGTVGVSVSYNGLTASATIIVIEINHSFMNATNAAVTFGGGAQLTGTNTAINGITDPLNQGWLRITSDDYSQFGYIYLSDIFTLSSPIEFEFQFTIWKYGSETADGLSAFLFDAGVTFQPGPSGRGIAYWNAQPVDTGQQGASGGYMAVFVSDHPNPCQASGADSICIRGSVVDFGNGSTGDRGAVNSYPKLGSRSMIRRYSLSYQDTSAPKLSGTDKIRPPEAEEGQIGYRKLIARVTEGPNPKVSVWIQYGTEAEPVPYLIDSPLPPISVDQRLKIGFGGGTGGATGFHEIRNLKFRAVNVA